MRKNVLIRSVGCRLNQFETDRLRTDLVNYGLKSDRKSLPDICIINTCTVTGKADRKSRALVQQTIRQYPRAFVIVTGCYAHTDAPVFIKMKGVDLVVKNDKKMEMGEVLKDKGIIDPLSGRPSRGLYISDRTRPYIKIQDGCDMNCTYCKVRIARGKSRSLDLNKVLDTARRLAERSYPEIVITGVNIGDYRFEGHELADLLKEMAGIRDLERIRLTSIEPANINERLLSVLRHEKICPYFHVPLQSGSDRILKLMNRPYTSSDYARLIERLQKIKKNVIIGSDVIVGFPGETEEDFHNTRELLKRLDIFYLHIFKYSPRAGTLAGSFKDNVSQKDKTSRSEYLHRYRDQQKAHFFNSLPGQRLNVIVEHKIVDHKFVSALADNYVPVLLPRRDRKYHRKIVPVHVIEFKGGHLYARII
ncbi:MAG: tRNA (N(6)-L-threonylcarbamoyladenosine(37)-C(2))-methylthiotransferase MtaB [Spirochaetes bacterium]|nr:tRNA (N(6)-L-threonylcarbamoyladenosine(37)-C(2))-methylthiotransferase MtaB [Spirochaetota bacterium]